MRKYLSVLALEVRKSIYKVLSVLAVLAAAEGICFYRYLRDMNRSLQQWILDMGAENLSVSQGTFWGLDEAVGKANVQILFYLAFCGICGMLVWAESARGSHPEYTLDRLSLDRKALFFLRTVYHVLCVLMLLAVQLSLVLGMNRILLLERGKWEAFLGPMPPQTVFLAFYDQPFLHGLLPLQDVLTWAANLFWILFVGLATAYAGEAAGEIRRSKIVLLNLALVSPVLFPTYLGWQRNLWLMLLTLAGSNAVLVLFFSHHRKLLGEGREA